MKKKKLWIIIATVILVTVAIASILFIIKKDKMSSSSNENSKESTVENTRYQLNQLLETELVDKNLTKSKVEEILGIPVSSQMYIMGNDSYIMERPSDQLVKKYNLSEYVEKQKIYAENIQNEFLKEYAYELTTAQQVGNEIHQTVSITTFYYGLYTLDINDLITWIVLEKKIDLSGEITEQQDIEVYKYKVMIMGLLDKNLDVYKNKEKERVEVEIYYSNGGPSSKDDLFSLLCNIYGLTYKNAGIDGANTKERQERMENYKQQVREMI